MKPSEYINTKLRYPIFTQEEYLKNIKEYDINLEKMDKRFIDREELKDKINDIDIWNKNGLKVKKEILELLK